MAGRGAPERQAQAWLYGCLVWGSLAGQVELGDCHTSQQDEQNAVQDRHSRSKKNGC